MKAISRLTREARSLSRLARVVELHIVGGRQTVAEPQTRPQLPFFLLVALPQVVHVSHLSRFDPGEEEQFMSICQGHCCRRHVLAQRWDVSTALPSSWDQSHNRWSCPCSCSAYWSHLTSRPPLAIANLERTKVGRRQRWRISGDRSPPPTPLDRFSPSPRLSEQLFHLLIGQLLRPASSANA